MALGNSGLLDLILGGLPVKPSSQPELKDNTISIKYTEAEFRNLLMSMIKDENSKRFASLIEFKMHEGYLEMQIRLR